MNVLVLCKDIDDPATRYRVDPVVEVLRRRGDEVRVVSEPGFLTQCGLLFQAGRFDLVFIQRKLFSPLYAKLLRRVARKLVYDHDDAVFSRSNGERSGTRSSRYNAVVSGADLVIGGNAFLCEEAGRSNARCEVVPTSVPTQRYNTEVFLAPDQPVTLVWIGSASTRRYLDNLQPVLEAVGEAIPGLQLKVIANFDYSLNSIKVINVAWSSDTEVAELKTSHVGIAPMIDDAWTRGKCALKVIQYMAAGLPVISSNVGANREVVIDGETGLLANTAVEWIEAVRTLMDDGARARMGAAGRQRAAEHYDLDASAEHTVALLDAV